MPRIRDGRPAGPIARVRPGRACARVWRPSAGMSAIPVPGARGARWPPCRRVGRDGGGAGWREAVAKILPRPLTARECATLERVARGMTQKMIAFEFGISVNTVGKHRGERVQEARRSQRRGRRARTPRRPPAVWIQGRLRTDPRTPEYGAVHLGLFSLNPQPHNGYWG